jgi:thiol-disulfide isomerase/thioredoxin
VENDVMRGNTRWIVRNATIVAIGGLCALPALGIDDPAPASPPAAPVDAPTSHTEPTKDAMSPEKARAIEQVINDIDGAEIPPVPAGKDGKFDTDEFDKFMAKRKEAVQRIIDLPLELYKLDPANERTEPAMSKRWSLMIKENKQPERVLDDTRRVIDENKGEAVVLSAMYWNAIAVGLTTDFNPEKTMVAVDRFVSASKDDVRAPQMLMTLAGKWTESDPARAASLLRRVVSTWPGTPQAQQAESMVKTVDSIGKPFELKFKDVVSNEDIDFQTKFKGKVVIVDFWATWCRPCVAEIPKLKELYKAHKDQGLEIVGISLDNPEDQGGKAKLLDFLNKNEITWYQYYQGGGWESAFSSGWGVTSIPRVFLVGRDGKLSSSNARGQIETLVQRELNKPYKAN